MLNAKEILEEDLLILENTKGKKSQVGYDLSLKEVNKIGGSIGKVFANQTILNKYTLIDFIELDGKEGWLLEPGVYDFVMNEGCKIPNNRVAFIKQRSSLLRNGALIQSSVFDPGFETKNIGTCVVIFEPIFIEFNSRVAQIYFHQCNPVEENDLYNGVWMGDKQRNH